MKKYEKWTEGMRINVEKKQYVWKYATKSPQNPKSCPNPCISGHDPVPYLCPSNHYRGYEKKMMMSMEKKKKRYLLFFPIHPLLQFGLFTHNCFPSLFIEMHIRKLSLKKLQESEHGGRHISEHLPSLQRTSRYPSMGYYTAATSLKVKKKIQLHEVTYVRDWLQCFFLSHTERHVVI